MCDIVAVSNDYGRLSMTLASISHSQRKRWAALAVIVAAQFMVILDVAIVNVALPAIKADLGFSQESLQWVITAYSVLFGGVLMLGGRLADLFGRRRLFMIGVAVFTMSSLLSGLAWSEGSLIAFRAASAALILAFVAIGLRSQAPLLPMRIFRLRTLAAANATAVVIAAVAFSQFFLLTLYMQQVLQYSAIRTGVAFIAITLTIIVFSNVAQTLVTRLGVRRVLASGLLLAAA